MRTVEEEAIEKTEWKADAVVAPSVEWMRRGDARKICGLGKDILDQWVRDDIVEAHKLHPGRNGTVIFSATDIRNAIRNAPRYKPNFV